MKISGATIAAAAFACLLVHSACAGTTSNAPVNPPAAPKDGPKPETGGDPVGLEDGCVYETAEDLRISCPGIDLVFRRAYCSLGTWTGDLGRGWTHSYEWRVMRMDGRLCVLSSGETGPSDVVHSFDEEPVAGGSEIWNPDGYALRRLADGEWELRSPDALLRRFDAEGLLVRIETWRGECVNVVRSESGRIARAVHSCGESLDFTYDRNGFLSMVSTPVSIDGVFRVAYADYAVRIVDEACPVLESVAIHDGTMPQSPLTTLTSHYAYGSVPRPGCSIPGAYCPYWKVPATAGQQDVWRENGYSAVKSVMQTGSRTMMTTNGCALMTEKTDANGVKTEYAYFRPSERPSAECVESKMDEDILALRRRRIRDGEVTLSRPTAYGVSRMELKYDGLRRETSRRTGAEVRTREYSPGGDMVAERLENEATGAFIEQRASYDSRHRPVSIGTGFNAAPTHFTSLSWDDRRNIPSRTVSPCGRVSEWRTNGLDVTVYGAGTGDPRLVTHVLMTPEERPRAIVCPGGERIDIAYNDVGYVTNWTIQGLPPISFICGRLGNVAGVSIPGPGGTKRQWNITSNWRGRPGSISRPDGTSESFWYDGGGRRVVRHVDALGREDVYKWVLGLPVHAGRILGGVTNSLFAVEHDKQLNVVAIVDPLGRKAETYVLDENERIVAVTNVEGQAMSRTYAVGDVVSAETRFDGTHVSYEYDADGNIAAVAYPDEIFRMTHDADGLLTSASNAVGTVSNEYDAATGWLTESAGADGTTVSYVRSLGGAVTSVVSAAGTTAYSRDAAGRWTHLASSAASFGFGYCGWNGKLAVITNGNGLVAEYSYDVMDRVTNISWRTTSGASLGGFAYEYDLVGRITSRRHELDGSTFDRAYTYDDFDRLASDGDVAYTYDAAGNRTTMSGVGGTTTYVLGVGDRLASWTGGSYTHDIAGNVTHIERDGRPTLDLTWNGQYQLVSVSTNGVFAESYTYDALSRRVSTTTLEGTVRHVYDDNWQVIADLDEQGSVIAAYVWGEGIDKLLAVTIGGATYYPLTDIQGTVWGYVDSQNNVVARWQYDAWGNVIAEDVSVPALARLRYRFQSREWSAATGLINFRMRWYDPETGRWLSKDPIRLSGGLNLYMFCLNNPMNRLDPFGRCTDDDWTHTILDIIGTFDPTPIADGINAIMYAIEGDWNNVVISIVAIVPFFGDAAKAGKYGVKAAKDFKRLSKGEVKALKKEIGDVHDIKINSKQDLFKNSNGDIYSFPKNGEGPGDETGYNVRDLQL